MATLSKIELCTRDVDFTILKSTQSKGRVNKGALSSVSNRNRKNTSASPRCFFSYVVSVCTNDLPQFFLYAKIIA